jgi:hypothetical protein
MLTFPLATDNKIDINDLTHASVDGNGVFDVLMRAVDAHLQKEWSANRLKGNEYSTVYLGALESAMNASLQFLLNKDKLSKELDLLEVTKAKTEAEIALLNQKRITEVANVDGTGVNDTSIIGKQNAVLSAQAAGYARDAEQKAAEIMMRGYSVLTTTQDLTATDSLPWGVNSINTSAAITKLLAGVN